MTHRLIPTIIGLAAVLCAQNALAQTANYNCAEYVCIGTSTNTISGISTTNDAVVAGESNAIGEDANNCAIAGGNSNTIAGGVAVANNSFIGAGYENQISQASEGFIGAGENNEIYGGLSGGAAFSFIGGGQNNTVDEDAEYAIIGGGSHNYVDASVGTIAGGGYNKIDGSSNNATIGGGYENTVSAALGTIPGGEYNTVSGEYGFAAGYGATASHEGSFVWSDSNGSCADSGTNQFVACSAGGFTMKAGASTCTLTSAGGSWACPSDRNLKRDITPIDGEEFLERLMQAPAYRWKYKTSDTPHLGPMAQDFKVAFEIGETDTRIGSLDSEGVALAAAQALYLRSRASEAQVRVLQAKNTELATKVVALEQKVAALSAIEARLAALEAKQTMH